MYKDGRGKTQLFTWKSENGEGGAEDQDSVANISQVEIIDNARAQHNKYNHKYSTVRAVIEVAHRGCLHAHEAGGCKRCSEHNKKRDGSCYARVL